MGCAVSSGSQWQSPSFRIGDAYAFCLHERSFGPRGWSAHGTFSGAQARHRFC